MIQLIMCNKNNWNYEIERNILTRSELVDTYLRLLVPCCSCKDWGT